jgi:hypothetical protein
MVGLPDLAPAKRIVNLRGTDVEVGPITGGDFVDLLMRYPEFKKAYDKKGSVDDTLVASVMKLAPAALAALVASALGKPGDKGEEKKILNLAVGELASLVAAILKVSLPDGTGPFEDVMEALGFGGLLPRAALGTAPPTASPEPSLKSPEEAANPSTSSGG